MNSTSHPAPALLVILLLAVSSTLAQQNTGPGGAEEGPMPGMQQEETAEDADGAMICTCPAAVRDMSQNPTGMIIMAVIGLLLLTLLLSLIAVLIALTIFLLRRSRPPRSV